MRVRAGDTVPRCRRRSARAAACRHRGIAAGDRALGEYLSSECVTCHQLSGRYQGIPPIVGWPEASFVEIMNEYRDKKRAQSGDADHRGQVFAATRSRRLPPISEA